MNATITAVITKDNLKQLSKARLNEARALADAGHYDGAVYLAGYAIELALKARICKHLKMAYYPADSGDKNRKIFATHDLELLALLGGIADSLNLGTAVGGNWSIVTQWGPEKRYSPLGSATQSDVQNLFDAIEDGPDSVFRWLRSRW